MELRCYSYDGGAPPMDSCSLEERMGVARRRAALQGLIRASIRPPGPVCARLQQLCVPARTFTQHCFNFPIPVPFEICVPCVVFCACAETGRSLCVCVCVVIVEKSPGACFKKEEKKVNAKSSS